MPAAGACLLSKGDVMMYLSLADLQRSCAAVLAGVSERTFRRYMKRHQVRAPRSDTVLSAADVVEMRALLEKHTQEEVAEIKNVHVRTVGQIERRETWYWV